MEYKKIPSVTRVPLSERVYKILMESIVSGDLLPGTELREQHVAKQMGVSATPVREAFQILARDGLIDLKQNKGATVLGLNETTIREHYEIRAALESAACVLCCQRKADLSAIRNCLEMADEALEKKDSSSYSNYNQSFHYEIWTAAGNEKLKTMLSEMWNGLSMGLKSTEEEYARNSQEEHRQILAALESGDPKQAGEKMVFHIIRSMNDVLTRY